MPTRFLRSIGTRVLIATLGAFTLAIHADIIRVDASSASGTPDGAAWATAYPDLQDALAVATAGDEIWVAKGTYYPTPGTDRTLSFNLVEGVAIYGGFAGTESYRYDRDWFLNETILSGNLGTGSTADNSYTVVFGSTTTHLSNATRLDGFTITGGNADVGAIFSDGGHTSRGGGIYLHDDSPTIANCTITANSATEIGGGIYCEGGAAVVVGCTLTGNSAASSGGGLGDRSAATTYLNCKITANTATLSGAGLNLKSSSTHFTNCLITGNSVANTSGVAAINGGSPVFVNCTIADNPAGSGGGGLVLFSSAAATLTNCILWGNGQSIQTFGATATVSASIVEGGYDGPNVLLDDPLFTGPSFGDYSLQELSSAIALGDIDALPADTTDLDGDGDIGEPIPLDLAGHQRLIDHFGNYVDAGAYEYLPAYFGPIWYVDADAGPGGNGSSWALAFNDLQDALADAVDGDEIWVAAGTYYPTAGTDRLLSFNLVDGVSLYGGFAGTEVSLNQRDIGANPTILSGQIGDTSIDTDNSYRVVVGVGVGAGTTVSGFTITGGYAVAVSTPKDRGAGMYLQDASPTISDCTFTGNRADTGGALTIRNASPTLTACTFTSNRSNYDGGAVYTYSNSSATFVRCSFSVNLAGSYGGAIMSSGATMTVAACDFQDNAANSGGAIFLLGSALANVVNASFIGNDATGKGGALHLSGSSARAMLANCLLLNHDAERGSTIFQYNGTTSLTNCTLYGGFSYDNIERAAVYLEGGALQIANSILWNKDEHDQFNSITSLTNSIVYGGYSGALDDDPLFVDPDHGDLTLQAGSPAIDAGSDGALPADVTDLDGDHDTAETVPDDLAGNARMVGAAVDIGAYEFFVPYAGPIWYVDADAAPGGDGSAWTAAFNDLQDALAAATSGDEIWVAEGTYYPTAGSDRSISFAMVDGVGIYGGFAGNETARDQRDYTTRVTILSGDIGTADYTPDNSFHVVTGSSTAVLDSTAILDGFSITAGNADGTEDYRYGGGLFMSGDAPRIANCTITGNLATSRGGGAYSTGLSPLYVRCTFAANAVPSGSGGGVYVNAANATFVACSILDNTALLGGGLQTGGSAITDVLLDNCLIAGNHGSGVSTDTPDLRLRNCTIVGNSGAGVSGVIVLIYLDNCIVWGNGSGLTGFLFTVSHSLVQGGHAGTGNLNADPLFIDPDHGDYRFSGASPAVNAGSNAALPADIADLDGDLDTGEALPLDLDGNPRVIATTVDLGAYETAVVSPVAAMNDTYTIGSDNLLTVSAGGVLANDSTTTAGPLTATVATNVSHGVLNLADDGSFTYFPADGYVGADSFTYTAADGADSATATVTITVTAVARTLSIDSITDTEADTAYPFTVTLSEVSGRDVAVDFATVAVSAAADADYLAAGGALTITAGQLTATIPVTVVADTIHEPAETFQVTLTNPRRATLGTATGTATILNDDAVPTVSLSASPATIAEAGGTATFTATLSNPTTETVTVTVTISGTADSTDFTASTHTIVIPPLSLTGTTTVTATDDTLYEPDANETVILAIGGVTNATAGSPSEAQTAIVDNDRLPTTLFVDSRAINGSNDGSSWQDAFTDLQDALAAAIPGDQIWVAEGAYYPTAGSDRSATFTLRDQVSLYGGFAGIETARDQRDYTTRVTILSGDIGTVGYTPDNSTNVVTMSFNAPNSATAILDGFTITKGVAESGGGAGIVLRFASPTLANCTIVGNRAANGGGLNFTLYSAPGLTNCTIADNVGTATTGGVFISFFAAPVFRDCTLADNVSLGPAGGIFLANASTLTMTNCVITGNRAVSDGGGLYAFSAQQAELVNCIFTDNVITGASGARRGAGIAAFNGLKLLLTSSLLAGNSTPGIGGAIYADYSELMLTNCTLADNVAGTTANGLHVTNPEGTAIVNSILWNGGAELAAVAGTPSVTYSLVQGGAPDATNLQDDPLFTDPDHGDYSLQHLSPAIDAGNADALPVDTTDLDNDGDTGEFVALDLAGNPRIFGAAIDIGAFERPNNPPVATHDTYTIGSDNLLLVSAAGVLANDTDADGNPLTATIATDVTHGVLNLADDGSFTYMPADGYSGPDSFTYTVTDGIASDTGSVAITVSAVSRTLSIDSLTDTEADTAFTFTVSLSHPSGRDVSVNYSTVDVSTTANADYLAARGPVTVTAGQMTATISVSVSEDTIHEPTETFQVNLSNPRRANLGTANGTGTILDDDPAPTVSLSASPATIGEAGGIATFTATLSNPTTETVTVTVAVSGTAGSSDFTASSHTIVIPPLAAAGALTVTALDDDLYEPGDPETVIVEIAGVANATGNGSQQAQTAILENDPEPEIDLNVTIEDPDEGTIFGTHLIEGEDNASILFELNRPSNKRIVLTFTFGGTAVMGEDYTASSSQIVIEPGWTSGNLDLAVFSDGLYEPGGDETIVLTIVSVIFEDIEAGSAAEPVGVSFRGVVTIAEDEPPQITITVPDSDPIPVLAIDDVSIGEDGGTATLTVSMTGLCAVLASVDYSTTAVTATAVIDYTGASGTLSWPAATNDPQTIAIPIVNDDLFESVESLLVTLGNPLNTDPSSDPAGTVSIQDNEDTMVVYKGRSGGRFVILIGYSGVQDGVTTLTGVHWLEYWRRGYHLRNYRLRDTELGLPRQLYQIGIPDRLAILSAATGDQANGLSMLLATGATRQLHVRDRVLNLAPAMRGNDLRVTAVDDLLDSFDLVDDTVRLRVNLTAIDFFMADISSQRVAADEVLDYYLDLLERFGYLPALTP